MIPATKARNLVIGVPILIAFSGSPLQADEFPGGFLETPVTAIARPLLRRDELQALLPLRGIFTFPAPYNTEAIRLSNSSDCSGNDCLNYVGYSYWRNINNHIDSDAMLILLSFDKSKGGNGPSLLEYNKVTDQVTNLGPIFESSSPYSWSTAEGWYFSASLPDTLYMNDGPRLLRLNVSSLQTEVVFDVSTKFGSNTYIWQVHSSHDDRVHSATLRDSNSYAMLGCVVYQGDSEPYYYYERRGVFDECQIDKSGNWLVIKENLDDRDGEDNRIINLVTGEERILLDSDGAAGHSDLGFGYMVAADNWANEANTQKLWNFNDDPLTGTPVYNNADWNVSAPEHLSHSNARPGVAAKQQYACGSSANRNNSAEANEIICFSLEPGNQALVVAPVMTDLNATGGGNDYAKAPKGNLDVSGKYFIWTSNAGSSRLDAYLVKVPSHLLGDASVSMPIDDPNSVPIGLIPDSDDGDLTAVDNQAPIQTNVRVVNITATSAVVEWTTDEPAISGVFYGHTPNYGYTSSIDYEYITSHSILLNGLLPSSTYHLQALAMDKAENLAQSSDLTFSTASGADIAAAQDVVWKQLVNVVADSSNITKVNGCDGCPDAFASSVQEISSGDGFIQFIVQDPYKLRYFGLSKVQSDSSPAAIDFALAIQAGYVEVREKGIYRADINVQPGDILTLSVQAGVVSYSRNDLVFYTSSTTPVYPLNVRVNIFDTGGSLNNVTIMSETESESNAIGITVPLQSSTSAASTLDWSSLVNINEVSNSLVKVAGCDGCPDAYAVSQSVLNEGDGFLEFTVNETNRLRYIGLSSIQGYNGPSAIDFALAIQAGYVEVRENGIYQADTLLTGGDVLRITLQSGTVSYSRNGNVFFVSQRSLAYPVNVQAALFSANCKVTDLKFWADI